MIIFQFAEATNFDLQGEVDLSLLGADWMEYQKLGFKSKLFFIPTSTQKSSIVQITLNNHILSGEAMFNTIGNRNEVTFEGILNKFNVRGSVVATDDYILSIDAVLPLLENVIVRGHLKDEMTNYGLKFDLNSKGKIVFAMSPKAFDFEARDIFGSESYKSTLTFEEDSLGGYRYTKPSIYVTGFSSISYCSNSEYWPLKYLTLCRLSGSTQPLYLGNSIG